MMMTLLRRRLLLLFLFLLLPGLTAAGPPPPLRALVITGGHAHDLSFYRLFEGQADWRVTVDGHPTAFKGDLRGRFDVIVLYDMPATMEEARRARLKQFAEEGGGRGKGIVALHHSLCAHPDWPWYYEELLGGGCVFTERPSAPVKSTYFHDETIRLRIAPSAASHPVVAGLPAEFTLVDETYQALWMAPSNRPLLTTDHPKAGKLVAWLSAYTRARVAVIQSGHDHTTHLDANYQRLVRNAIRWAADSSRR